MSDPLLTADDRLLGQLARDLRDNQELLSIVLAQHHATLSRLATIVARYDRLLEDFRTVQDAAPPPA